jgi:hypothetical protein
LKIIGPKILHLASKKKIVVAVNHAKRKMFIFLKIEKNIVSKYHFSISFSTELLGYYLGCIILIKKN